MAGPFYYRHYIGDYDTATKELSLLEHGVYRRLLDGYYAKGTLSSDTTKLYRVAGAFSPEEQQAVQRVATQMFIVDGDRLRHDRADAELDRIKRESEIQADRARKRWHGAGHSPGSAPADATASTKRAVASKSDAPAMPVKSQESKKKGAKKEKVVAQAVDIPDWIPRDLWDKYVAQRPKKPTDHAVEMLIEKLADIQKLGFPPAVVLKESIANGWTGLFVPKGMAPVGKGGTGRREQIEASNERLADSWADRHDNRDTVFVDD